jgi:hypothetical protein
MKKISLWSVIGLSFFAFLLSGCKSSETNVKKTSPDAKAIGYADFAKKNKIRYGRLSGDGNRFVTFIKEGDTNRIHLWDSTKKPFPLMEEITVKDKSWWPGLHFALSDDASIYAIVAQKPKLDGIIVEVRNWAGNVKRKFEIEISTVRLDKVFVNNTKANLCKGVAFSPDASRLAVIHKKDWGNTEGLDEMVLDREVVVLFDLKTGKKIAQGEVPVGNYQKIAYNFSGNPIFSPDGKYIQLPGLAWQIKKNEHRFSKDAGYPTGWLMDTDSMSIASDYGIRALEKAGTDKEMDKIRKKLPLPEDVNFSQDGSVLLAWNWIHLYLFKTGDSKPQRQHVFSKSIQAAGFWDTDHPFAVFEKYKENSFAKFFTTQGDVKGKFLPLTYAIPRGKPLDARITEIDGAPVATLVTSNTVYRYDLPSEKTIRAARQQRKALEYIESDFLEEGEALLLKSHQSDPDFWWHSVSMHINVEFFRDVVQKGKISLTSLGRLYLADYNHQKNNNDYRAGISLRNYGALALAAGHPGIALQAAAELRKMNQELTAVLIEAGAKAGQGDAKGAYRDLINAEGRFDRKKVTEHFKFAVKLPDAYKPLYAERKKLAYLTGKKEADLPKPKKGWQHVPYPDLSGKLINPITQAPKLEKKPRQKDEPVKPAPEPLKPEEPSKPAPKAKIID